MSGEQVPVWIANYVLVDYGTGAVMGSLHMMNVTGNLLINMICLLNKL